MIFILKKIAKKSGFRAWVVIFHDFVVVSFQFTILKKIENNAGPKILCLLNGSFNEVPSNFWLIFESLFVVDCLLQYFGDFRFN